MTSISKPTRRRKPPSIHGKRVSRLRERLGLSPADFATAFGVHQATIYRWAHLAKPKLRPAHVQLVLKLEAQSDDYLKRLGLAIAQACRTGGGLEAPRMLFDAASYTTPAGVA